MIRTSRRSRKAPERLTYQAKEERQIDEEDNENITDPVESDYEGKLNHFFQFFTHFYTILTPTPTLRRKRS